ncbi:MAG: thymidine phosphorylase [Candidatus Liptonbacteria bacterium]|nr:thymidine phosphorylase [Candidatus Liptonbacteria bacterium]
MIKNNKLSFFLKVKKIDILTGHPWIIILNEKDCHHFGITAGYKLVLKWRNKETEVVVDTTTSLVKGGEVGMFSDILKKYHIQENELAEFSFSEKPNSLKAIHKKLLGETLTYEEIYSVIKDVVDYRLNDIDMAFFSAPLFNEKSLSKEEIYYLTKAFCETGEILKFGYPVADKHSVGGLPGNRVTPIIVSIVASYDVIIPKTSSRAITSAAGTADTFEALAPVGFSSDKIKEIVKKTNACLVWGGSLKLAPADDRFIKVFYQLGIEPYLKMAVSVMSKKIAMGVTHLVLDIPVGPTAKIFDSRQAKKIKTLFLYLSDKFGIKTKVLIDKAVGPIGRGIGVGPEARDVLRVLQQKPDRPTDLEKKSIWLAGNLLDLLGIFDKGAGQKMAKESLINGLAWKKMQEIILAQGGKVVDSEKIKLGKETFCIKSSKTGVIESIHNKNLVEVVRLLGSPEIKAAGVYLNKTVGEQIKRGEILFTLYAPSPERLSLALGAVKKLEIFRIV